MGFWTAIAIIAIVAIVTEFVLRIVKMGTRHYENIQRIRHGYPTLDGARSKRSEEAWQGEHVEHMERLQ